MNFQDWIIGISLVLFVVGGILITDKINSSRWFKLLVWRWNKKKKCPLCDAKLTEHGHEGHSDWRFTCVRKGCGFDGR